MKAIRVQHISYSITKPIFYFDSSLKILLPGDLFAFVPTSILILFFDFIKPTETMINPLLMPVKFLFSIQIDIFMIHVDMYFRGR